MSGNILSVDDLVNYHEKKTHRRQEKFAKLLKQCHNKIKIATKIKLTSCWYIIPGMVDELIFKDASLLKECAEYLSEKLKNGGFKVSYYAPNVMHVSWTITKK
jgi:hypothetical protein